MHGLRTAIRNRGAKWILLGTSLALVLFAALFVVLRPSRLRLALLEAQTECPMYLRALLALEKAHADRSGTYSLDFQALGFSPPADGRYLYFASDAAKAIQRIPPGDGRRQTAQLLTQELNRTPPLLVETLKLGLRGTCPDCELAVGCAGQLDGDDELDIWTISTRPRNRLGQSVPAGEPFHERDDLR